MRRRRSSALIFATSCRASRLRRARRIRPSWTSCGRLPLPNGQHRPRSRSRGCSPSSRGSCRSPARPSCSAWTRTSAPRRSGSRPTTCVRSTVPPRKSRSRARAIPNTSRNGRGSEMRVGILGSGLMGGKLGTIFARTGHEVVFIYARSQRKLERLAREAKARAGTPNEAAREADALLLAVHWSRVDDVLQQAGDVSGKVIVSCSLPMNADDTGLVIAHTSSGAEALATKVPKARVVSAFGTVPSEVLFGVFAARRKAKRPSLLYCGDDARGKRTAAELIRDVGFDPVDAGPLRIARYLEPFTLLIAQLAYEGDRGPELAYRFEWLGKS